MLESDSGLKPTNQNAPFDGIIWFELEGRLYDRDRRHGHRAEAFEVRCKLPAELAERWETEEVKSMSIHSFKKNLSERVAESARERFEKQMAAADWSRRR